MAWSSPITLGLGQTYLSATYNLYTTENLKMVWHEASYIEQSNSATVSVDIEESGLDDAAIIADAEMIVSAETVQCDGVRPVEITYFCPHVVPVASSNMYLWLFDETGALGRIGFLNAEQPAAEEPVFISRRFIPVSGLHTYSIRGSVNGAAGEAWVFAVGNLSNPLSVHLEQSLVPGFIRVMRQG